MLLEGDVVGRFVVDRMVGRGAMASVYRVVDRETRAPFALKVLDLAGTLAAERFAREAEVQARLRHRNVVALVEALEVSGLAALVMEYVDGLSLELLLQREPLEVAQVDLLFGDILAGVEAAHAAGIVHRDLKPANVLVGEEAGLRVAKVGDFGLVKLLVETDRKLTLGSAALGTPGFMAPEQAFDSRAVDARADLYSLGCILYGMTTGKAAFPGDARERFANAATGKWTDPRVYVPALPERFVRAIQRCLEVDPARRPADVAELRELVRAAPEHDPDTMETALADLARMLAPPSLPPGVPRAPPAAPSVPPVVAPPVPPVTRTVSPVDVGRPPPPPPPPRSMPGPPPVPPATRTVTPAAPPPAPLPSRAGVPLDAPSAPPVPPATRSVIPLDAPPAAPSPAAAPPSTGAVPASTGASASSSPAASSSSPSSPSTPSPSRSRLLLVGMGCGLLALAGVGLAGLAWLGWSMAGWPRFG